MPLSRVTMPKPLSTRSDTTLPIAADLEDTSGANRVRGFSVAEPGQPIAIKFVRHIRCWRNNTQTADDPLGNLIVEEMIGDPAFALLSSFHDRIIGGLGFDREIRNVVVVVWVHAVDRHSQSLDEDGSGRGLDDGVRESQACRATIIDRTAPRASVPPECVSYEVRRST